MSNPSFSDPVSDEILSAYIDGELSATEVLAVERWLKSSPQARQKLADFQRLSGLLQDLPQEELPEEFASQVMAQAERQMLLPVSRRLSVPSIARRVRFWAVSVGLPVAAACLLIAIQWNRPKDAQEFAEAIPGPAPISPKAIASNELASERNGDTEQPPASLFVADSEPGHGTVLSKIRQDASPPPEAVTESNSNGLESSDQNQIAENGQSPGKASILTVLNQIEELNAAGKIPVVRMFVVDRQDGLEVLQVMLEGQKIARDPSAATERHQDETVSDKRALFVVASAKELTSALKALEEKSGAIESWKLSEPVDLARFDQSSQSRMSDLMALVAGARPEPPTGMVVGANAAIGDRSEQRVASSSAPTEKPSARRTSPRKSSPPERAASPDREGGGLADVPFAKPGRRSSASPGQQVLVTMNDPIPSSQAGNAIPGETAIRASEPGRGGPRAPLAKGTETPETDVGIRSASADRQPPMRVLFVIERQEISPAAPAKEAPGGGAA